MPIKLPVKFLLNEDEIPRQWYNLAADLPSPMLPPLGPDGKPIAPEALARGVSHESHRAGGEPGALDRHPGRDHRNSLPVAALSAQARRVSRTSAGHAGENLLQGRKRLARRQPQTQHRDPAGLVQQTIRHKDASPPKPAPGQWGSALAFACSLIGLECKVFMVRISFEQKPFRKIMMQTWGGKCIASPSTETEAGRAFLKKDPNTPGSLGIAISEAVEAAVTDKSGTTKYSLGSVLNHVLLHQTIIGLEAKKQLQKTGIKKPDVVIACAGGGSNFGGLAFPFVADKIARRKDRDHPGGARLLPHHDPRHIYLRLRRLGRHDAAASHAHARPQFHARAHPRRRTALSRHGAARVAGDC